MLLDLAIHHLKSHYNTFDSGVVRIPIVILSNIGNVDNNNNNNIFILLSFVQVIGNFKKTINRLKTIVVKLK